jgi:hypothetical protein
MQDKGGGDGRSQSAGSGTDSTAENYTAQAAASNRFIGQPVQADSFFSLIQGERQTSGVIIGWIAGGDSVFPCSPEHCESAPEFEPGLLSGKLKLELQQSALRFLAFLLFGFLNRR